MKKNLVFSILFLGASSLFAQKVTEGSFAVLSDVDVVCLSIDYSDAMIDGVPFEVFHEGEENWDKGYRDILIKFIKGANRKSDKLKFLSKKPDGYELVLKANKCDRDGETYGSLILKDKDGKVVAKADKFNAEGGSYGSQMNLMGDAAERMGGKVARFLKKQMK